MKKFLLSIALFSSTVLSIFAQSQSNFELPAITPTDIIIKHTAYTLSYNKSLYRLIGWPS